MNRITGRTGWLVSVTIILVVTLGSPVLLVIIGKSLDADWAMAANVGDSYGFASAALAGLAFLGVAYSMLLQRHEVRASRMETHRNLQLELYRFAMNDPSLREVFFGKCEDGEHQRQMIYMNLWFQFLRTGYVEMGTTGERELRGDIVGLFSRSDSAIDYWEWSRSGWISTDTIRGSKDKRFIAIVDSIYLTAVRNRSTDAGTESGDERGSATRGIPGHQGGSDPDPEG
jgi:hypothetical protein